MECPSCRTEMVRFPVPTELRQHLPEDSPGAAICPSCLVLEPDADPPAEPPDFSVAVADPFPDEPEAGIAMAVSIGLLTSLALYRSDIDALFERVEAAGTDPLLALDRLATAGSIDSHVDLQGRRQQLEQLLE
jgi:hypothetical protein